MIRGRRVGLLVPRKMNRRHTGYAMIEVAVRRLEILQGWPLTIMTHDGRPVIDTALVWVFRLRHSHGITSSFQWSFFF